jgi:hypothetical protein
MIQVSVLALQFPTTMYNIKPIVLRCNSWEENESLSIGRANVGWVVVFGSWSDESLNKDDVTIKYLNSSSNLVCSEEIDAHTNDYYEVISVFCFDKISSYNLPLWAVSNYYSCKQGW